MTIEFEGDEIKTHERKFLKKYMIVLLLEPISFGFGNVGVFFQFLSGPVVSIAISGGWWVALQSRFYSMYKSLNLYLVFVQVNKHSRTTMMAMVVIIVLTLQKGPYQYIITEVYTKCAFNIKTRRVYDRVMDENKCTPMYDEFLDGQSWQRPTI